MKKMLILLFLLFLLFVSFSADCSNIQEFDKDNINKIIVHENRFDKLIDLAESYGESNPEFAINCAYKAHEIAGQTNDVKQSLKSNMMMGDIFYNYGAHINAISYYDNAIDAMLLLNDYESIYKMYMKIAYIYNDFDIDDRLGVESMMKAVDYANKCQSDIAVMEANMAMGDIYFQQGDNAAAMTSYQTVLKYKLNEENRNFITKALTSKAKILMRLKEYDEAMFLIDSSMRLCESSIDSLGSMINYACKAEIYDSLRDFDNAKKYYIKAIASAYNIREFGCCGEYMYGLGMLEKKIDSIDVAIDVLKILCDSTEKYKWFDISYRSYYQLSKCYAEINDYKKAYDLFNKYDVLYDSANMSKHNKKVVEIYTGYNLSLNVEELKYRELKDINDRKSKISKTIVAVSATVLSIMLIALVIIYSRNKIIYYKNQETVYDQQLKIEKMQSELMEIQLKKNKELLMNLALHFKSYIEYITPIKKGLKDILDSSDSDNKSKIKNIYMSIQNNTFLFNNMENLNDQINDIHKDFLCRLEQKYPDMTKSEKRLCAMLYINMSSKEIAAITNTTLRSVETSRYRLRKKFNLSRDEDMINFLRNI